MKNDKVFKRFEKKYLLNKEQYENLMAQLVTHMEVDRFGWHTISNLYFDTDTFELIRSSIEKPTYKEKLRLRAYGDVTPDSTGFLELKKKFDGVVYKRRVALPMKTVEQYLSTGRKPEDQNQILNEIDWFMKRYTPQPTVMIAYDRLALQGRDTPELRVTFDHKVRFRDYDLDLTHGTEGEHLLDHNSYIMEIKVAEAMPLWMTGMLNQLEIYPTTFSKYGTCYKQYLIHHFNFKGGAIIA